MISGFSFYCTYTAVNMHFKENSKYDFFKYNGKTKVSEKSFIGRKDKYFFEKHASKVTNTYHAQNLLWSCLLFDPSLSKDQVYIRNVNPEFFFKLRGLTDSFNYRYKTWLENNLTSSNKLDIKKIGHDVFTSSPIGENLIFLCVTDILYKHKILDFYKKSDDFILCEQISQKVEKTEPFVKHWLQTEQPTFWSDSTVLLRNVLCSKQV